jgi:hypothetical protein
VLADDVRIYVGHSGFFEVRVLLLSLFRQGFPLLS